MASQPQRSTRDRNFVIAANGLVLMAKTTWWHCCSFTSTDGKNRMMASEMECFQRAEMSQCCDITANCPVLMAREPYDSIAANAPSLTARTERWHHSQISLQSTWTCQPCDIAAHSAASLARTIWWHYCKFTFGDVKNKKMASHPQRSSKDWNYQAPEVPLFRHSWKLSCNDGQNNMTALLQMHPHWLREQVYGMRATVLFKGPGCPSCPTLLQIVL